ncbi:hypothetical protein Tco_1061021 [Tanacetum coccineum]
MGKFRETLAEGALHLGLKRDRVFTDLTPKEKERYKTDICATNILLQDLPKDIYTLINHYTDAKHIWDNNKGETIHEYYVRFTKLINDMRNIKMTMPKMQLNSKFLKQHEAHANENKIMLERYNQHAIDPLAFTDTFDDDVDEAIVQDFALNEDNVFQADQCDAFDSDVDEAPTAQTMFMKNLSSADPIYDEAGLSYDSDILSEYVKDNAVQVVQSNVSSMPNDALMMIINDMHE